MPTDFWGATGSLGLLPPTGAPAIGLFVASTVLLAWLLFRLRTVTILRGMTRPQWMLFAGLLVASFILSQLFPLQIPWTNPLLDAFPATSAMVLLSATAYLVAGAALNIPAAMLVGLASGFGRAVGQTGSPIDII